LDFPALKGTPILAAADGVVALVKNFSDSFAGKYTVIDHGSGLYTRYLHADQNLKQVGDRVKRGEQIGNVGTTGTVNSGPHVHFDVLAAPAAAAEYLAKFGKPTTGFSAGISPWGVGVPAEPLMDKAIYKPGILEASIQRGVKMFSMHPVITIGGLLLVGGAGYLLYRHLKK
jgi:murein DD-endopeptidase MepM/ murein hydrolase activator NlpD